MIHSIAVSNLMAQLQETVLGFTKPSTEKSEPTDDEILSYFEDPKMLEYIINAKPLDSLDSIAEQPSSECLAEEHQDFESETSQESATTRKRSLEKTESEIQSKSKKFKKSPATPMRSLPKQYLVGTSSTSQKFKPTMPGRSLPRQHQAEGNIQLVSSRELTQYPQNSVGKLFWFDSSLPHHERVEPVHWSTAFYVGDSKIMTVSHVVYGKGKEKSKVVWNINAAVFVPAMIDKFDIYGKNYGHYAVGVRQEHPKYKPDLWQYDISTLKLLSGRKIQSHHCPAKDPSSLADLQDLRQKEQVNDFFYTVEINKGVEIGLNAIQLRFHDHQQEYNDGTSWTVYGYGEKNRGGTADNGSDGGKMTKVVGKILPNHNDTIERLTLNLDLIGMDIVVRRGMSGGPWILNQDGVQVEADGCQAASSISKSLWKRIQEKITGKEDPLCRLSLSPYFSRKLLNKIGYP